MQSTERSIKITVHNKSCITHRMINNEHETITLNFSLLPERKRFHVSGTNFLVTCTQKPMTSNRQAYKTMKQHHNNTNNTSNDVHAKDSLQT